MSEKRPEIEFGSIDTAADAAGTRAESRGANERISELEAQLAKIEPLLEQLQNNAKTANNLANYVDDLRSEQVFFNHARTGLALIAGAVVVLLIALLWIAIFHGDSPLLKAPPAAIAAVILGVVSGIVFLINSFAKGLFRSTADRHADGFLPPALEKGLEIAKKVAGNS